MMDLDESLRALYFAPIPLIVLDSNRYIRMLNRPAERLLATTSQVSVGLRLENWVIAAFRQGFTQALNDAAQSSRAKTWDLPIFTRLTFCVGDSGEGQEDHVVGAECSISAWFPQDQMFAQSATPFDGGDQGDSFASGPVSPLSSMESPQSTPMHEHGRSLDAVMKSSKAAGIAPQNLLHEAYYTISLTPTQTRERRMSPSEAKMSKADVLRDSLLHTLDTPLMALSRDGTTLVRNRACDETLKWFEKKAPIPNVLPPEAPDPLSEEPAVNLSWLTDAMTCYTEDFTQIFPPHKFPIYRCAVLGERPPVVNVGCVSSGTGMRRVFRVVGQPVRDAGGYGEHVGGVIQIHDVTEEVSQRNALALKQGTE